MSRAEWLRHFRGSWRQGEHIALIGPTGSGKTGLAAEMLAIRQYVVVFAIKQHDDTIKEFQGYRIIKKWPPEYGEHRVILWVKPQTLGDIIRQRDAIINAMERVYIAGGWCVYFDDLSYVSDQLRIKTPVVTFMNQGRSSGISVVAAATRPRKVPVEAFNQVRHVVSFHYDDRRELERIAEIAGIYWRDMVEYNQLLRVYKRGYSDFLSIGKGTVILVRNQNTNKQ